MPSRKQIPRAEIEKVLLRSKRRCALCFDEGVRQPTTEGAIAHLAHNLEQNDEDNLVFLCFNHHRALDAGEGGAVERVRSARNRLYTELETGSSRHLVSGAAWQHFEERVINVLADDLRHSAGGKVDISRRRLLPGRSGMAREVDLAAELDLAGAKVLIVAEVKYSNAKIGVAQLASFGALLEDIGANKGIVVASSSFSAEAMEYARRRGISLLAAREGIKGMPEINSGAEASGTEASPRAIYLEAIN